MIAVNKNCVIKQVKCLFELGSILVVVCQGNNAVIDFLY